MAAIELTNQEVYSRVKAHLLAQNARSQEGIDDWGDPVCKYRGPEGRKCAVGCLIPDELYNPEFEGSNANYLCKEGVFPAAQTNLLTRLQRIHDLRKVEEWPEFLTAVAREFELKDE